MRLRYFILYRVNVNDAISKHKIRLEKNRKKSSRDFLKFRFVSKGTCVWYAINSKISPNKIRFE